MTKQFKVYVAASTAPAEISRARAVSAGLRLVGVKVTSTWPERVEESGGANLRSDRHVDRRAKSLTCIDEIEDADGVLVLVPRDAASFGAGWEAGHAHSAAKHLAFSGDTARSVFCSLGVEFERDGAAIAHFGELAEKRRERFDFDFSDVTQPMRAPK